MPITYASAAQSFLALYAAQAQRLISVRTRISLSEGNCRSLIDASRLESLDASLGEKLKPLIAEFYKFREYKEALPLHLAKLKEKLILAQTPELLATPTGDATSEASKTCNELRQKIDPALNILMDRIVTIAQELLIARDQAKTTFEAALAKEGKPIGVAATLRGLLPTTLGGTWPRVNAAMAEYAATLPAPAAAAEEQAPVLAPIHDFDQEARELTRLLKEAQAHVAKMPIASPPSGRVG